jgi:hypothetical protein
LSEINVDLTTSATNYVWTYSGTGVTVSAISGFKNKVNILAALGATSGDVCVGVNYSVSPNYKKYCKTVTICPSGARYDDSTEELKEHYELHQNDLDEFVLKVAKDAKEFKIFDVSGKLVYNVQNLSVGYDYKFGDNISNGIKVLIIYYTDGTYESVKISK